MKRIEIRTDAGVMPTFEFGDASAPSVLCYIDGIGMRPAIQDVAARIAAGGYRVLLPDVFYRIGAYTAPEPKALFTDPAVRAEWWGKLQANVNQDTVMSDTRACLDYLPGKVGVTGYCMGGRMALVAAATYPDRIVAAAAYHPGGLVTDAPDSAHLLAPKIKARVYIGRAIEDQGFDDTHLQKLDEALTAAGVAHEIETYPAKHGWVPSDTPVYDATCADRHYETLFALLQSTLR